MIKIILYTIVVVILLLCYTKDPRIVLGLSGFSAIWIFYLCIKEASKGEKDDG
jgi:hypothetical protein